MNLKKKIFDNKLYAWLLSLVMAIFLWSYVMGVENPEIDIPYRGIEVDYTGEYYLKKEGLSIISPDDPKVNIKITGTKNDISNIDSTNFKAVLDLEGLKAGENRVSVDVSLQGQTDGIKIVDIEPSSIVVNLDELVSENIKIDTEILSELEDGYTLGKVRALNNYVRVTGPSSKIKEIDKVVAYADILGKTDTFMTTSNIIFLDKNDIEIKDIDSNIDSIDIEVPIYKLKSVPIKVNTVGTLGENAKLEDVVAKPNTVIIRGSKDQVDKLVNIETEPINVAKLVEDTNYKPVFKLPEGIAIHENTPIKINYKYVNNVESSKVIPKEKIGFKNEKPGYTYEIIGEFTEVSALIYGEESLVETIKDEDLVSYVDCENLVDGDNTTNIIVENIDGITVKNIEPISVTVRANNNGEQTNLENTNENPVNESGNREDENNQQNP